MKTIARVQRPATARRATTTAPSSGRIPTLADVAKLVGVTKITVSRALNEPGRVAPDTLARVREAIRQTGYVPNLLAGALSSQRTRLIVALVPTVAGTVFIETMLALRDRLGEAGYQLLIGQAGYDESHEDELLNAVIGRRPDGIVLTGVSHSDAARRRLRIARIPVVETWELTAKPIDMLVGFSHAAIGAAAANHLLVRGRRRLAVISPDDRRARIRAESFAAMARQAAGASPSAAIPAHQVVSPAGLGEGRTALRTLLMRDPTIDGVYCGSDMLALGALIEAKAQRVAVPERLAVIGYGDLGLAKDTDPALTTIRIDGKKIGRIAGDMLIARATGRVVRPRVVDVGFTILTRAST